MGGIRRQRKKIMTSGHPYDKTRIDQELPLVGEYGLRNKKELWKARTVLSKARQQARALLALPAEVREQREKELLSRLANLGVLPPGSDLDSVLALDVRTVLNRRLQTVVHKKGLANSPYQARQFIAHRHIAIERAVVTSPGRLIKVNEEENIDYAPLSPLIDKSHPARPQAPPTTEVPPEKKEAPKARKKPKTDQPKPPTREEKPVPKKEVDQPKPPAREEKPIPKKEVDQPKPPAKPKALKVDVSEIKGVGAKTAMLLKEGGFDTVDKIASTKVEDLTKVPGIGDATAKKMIDEAKNILASAKEEAK